MKDKFENTEIWKKTLCKRDGYDIYEKHRDFLRSEFLNFREKAKVLAGEISRVLPEFTVHDIEHIDALWESASLMVGKDFNINPVEAFVLGGAFLIHDLGMGLASFPDGIDALKKEPIWKDTVASLTKRKNSNYIVDKSNRTDYIDKDIELRATETVLRLLHAKHAENLAKISWKDDNGNNIFLIENIELREAYGSIIGLIAYSHCWKVSQLEEKLPGVKGALGDFPSEWTIDPIKIASILRIADAIQIDDRRAPLFLKVLRKPTDYSKTHWNFQQKLYKPILKNNRLLYTSKSSFSINEIDSWWVCYDTLKMIDNELKEVDALLVDTNRQSLNALGVIGVDDTYRISKLISTDGWEPVDTNIKVGNVAELVNKLGGSQLYGDDLLVPLRELIQNAADAIRARRLYEDEDESFGDIKIKIGNDEYGEYIEIEDNGIGMSPRVLTGPFLDFGQSFWGSSLMYEELPGLESKGFNSTGKYGIGFFSVFIWGKKVSIYTKRFEDGRDSTRVLEFKEGVSSRPILRKAKKDEYIKDGGTRICIRLDKGITTNDILNEKFYKKNNSTFEEVLKELCLSIDCNIVLETESSKKKIIYANEWKTIEPVEFMKRIIGFSKYNKLSNIDKELIEKLSKNLALIVEENGRIVGRACIFKDIIGKRDIGWIEGAVTVGGFRTSKLTGIIGILEGISNRASRDIGVPIVSRAKLSEWATNQAEALMNLDLTDEQQIESASIVRVCNGKTLGLKIAYNKVGAVNYEMIKTLIKEENYNECVIVQDAAVSGYERENSVKIDFENNVFWGDCACPIILQTGKHNTFINWPKMQIENKNWFDSLTLVGIIYEAFSDAHKKDLNKIIEDSKISSDEKKYNAIVGSVKDEIISFEHVDIIINNK
ncbi:HD domain-containing protein [Clostridium baratii]|uniref:HD domain-containing protein n=1 Tax=Clostridium baratii TaxID=1561 RepID=UPI0030CF8E69